MSRPGSSPGPAGPADGVPHGVPRTVSGRGAEVDVLGVVLCGGQSRRMGSDKARVMLDGRRLIDGPLEALGGLCRTVVLASGSAPRYPELGREELVDPVPGGGPLAGLAAALAWAAARDLPWVAVLACDMPRADARVLRELHERARRDDLDLCLLAGPGGLEPLFGVYHVRCREAVERALARGDRRMISFHDDALGPERRALRRGVVSGEELDPALGGRDAAQNLNTQAELARERARRSTPAPRPRQDP